MALFAGGMAGMVTILEHPDGEVLVAPGGGRNVVDARPRPGLACPFRRCRTSYPIPLIATILRVKGPGYLVDEILREEHPGYVAKAMRWGVFPFVPREEFAGKTVLDFGCGCGASSVVLARLLPDCAVVGVDLDVRLLEVAKARSQHYGLTDRVRFVPSPGPTALPTGLGAFDYVMLSAVYEHLLPDERAPVLQLLWGCLREQGVLFVNQTPNRWCVVETHTTGGLPLLNYVPDAVAHRLACRLGRAGLKGSSWQDLLRAGIRGASRREIASALRRLAAPGTVRVLPIRCEGVRDEVALWYQGTSVLSARKRAIKKVLSIAARRMGPLRVLMLPSVQFAVRKTGYP